jgi:hypothetical protein
LTHLLAKAEAIGSTPATSAYGTLQSTKFQPSTSSSAERHSLWDSFQLSSLIQVLDALAAA